jgi:hypothetical protein
MFPLFDIWRLAIVEPTIARATLTPLVRVLASTSETVSSSPHATFLTLLRLTTNAFGTSSLFRLLLLPAGAHDARPALTSVLVQTPLHQDRLLRVAAASLAFNVGAWVQRSRVARIKGEEAADGIRADQEDGEWEVELVSAVAEVLSGEEEDEDAGELYRFLCSPGDHDHGRREIRSLTESTFFFDLVHRLTATLAFLIRLSPFYEDQLVPLLSVLRVGDWRDAEG